MLYYIMLYYSILWYTIVRYSGDSTDLTRYNAISSDIAGAVGGPATPLCCEASSPELVVNTVFASAGDYGFLYCVLLLLAR